jgi:hypothetical protein
VHGRRWMRQDAGVSNAGGPRGGWRDCEVAQAAQAVCLPACLPVVRATCSAWKPTPSQLHPCRGAHLGHLALNVLCCSVHGVLHLTHQVVLPGWMTEEGAQQAGQRTQGPGSVPHHHTGDSAVTTAGMLLCLCTAREHTPVDMDRRHTALIPRPCCTCCSHRRTHHALTCILTMSL